MGTPDLLVGAGIPLRRPTAGVPLDETSDVAVRSSVFVESAAFTPLLCDRVGGRFKMILRGGCSYGIVEIHGRVSGLLVTVILQLHNGGIGELSTKSSISRGWGDPNFALYSERFSAILYNITASWRHHTGARRILQ